MQISPLRWLLLAWIVLAGFGLALFGLHFAIEIENASATAALQREAAERLDAVENRLQGTLNVLRAVKAFFDVTGDVSADQFRGFVSPLLANEASIKAVEWVPDVRDDAREAFEAGERSSRPQFAITEIASHGGLVPAARRPDYFPVRYVEPLAGNEPAIGFDLASNEARRAALTGAIRAEAPRATGRIELVQAAGRTYGVLVYLPVFANAAGQGHAARGLVTGVIEVGAFAAAGANDSGALNISLSDMSAEPAGAALYPLDIAVGAGAGDALTLLSRDIEVAGRNWRLSAMAAKPAAASPHLAARLVFATALLLTAALAWIVFKRFEADHYVAVRTRELEAARQRLSGAVEALTDGFTLYDRHGRIQLANSAYRKMFPALAPLIDRGASFSELAKVGVAAGYFRPFDKRTAAWRQAREQGKPLSIGPIESDLPDGRWIRLTEQSTPSGDIVGLRSDITAVKTREFELAASREEIARQAEALTAQAERLEELAAEANSANKAKSAFLAVVSHEIRTPITAIFGFAQLLATTRLDDAQAEYAAIIEASAQHLRSLVEDILDFSRIEAGVLALEPAPFSLRDLVSTLEATAKMLLSDKPIDLQVSVNLDGDPVAVGDRARLTQVCLNLISNAVKFTREGHVRLSIAWRCDAEGAQALRVEVADTGIGIRPEFHARIFDMFEQGGVDDEARRAGVGLGLAISRRLVTAMGGTLEMESEPDRGTRFWFEVPMSVTSSDALRKAGATGNNAASAMKPLRVLIADDADATRRLIEIMLRKLGHEVTSTEDGGAAVISAQQGYFDLAILDLQMPILDGAEVARVLRGLPDGLGAGRIVALTAEVLSDSRRKQLDPLMDEVLPKPFDYAMIQRIIAQARQVAEAAQA